MPSSLTLCFEDGNMIGILSIITPMLYHLCKVSSSLPVGWTLSSLPKYLYSASINFSCLCYLSFPVVQCCCGLLIISF